MACYIFYFTKLIESFIGTQVTKKNLILIWEIVDCAIYTQFYSVFCGIKNCVALLMRIIGTMAMCAKGYQRLMYKEI